MASSPGAESVYLYRSSQSDNTVFVESACGDRGIVQCMCMRAFCVVHAQSGFVRAITCTFVHGFQNNMAQLVSSMSKVPFETFFSGRLKVKVTLKVK